MILPILCFIGFGYTNIQSGMMREGTIKCEPLQCLCESFWCNCQKIICPTSKHTEGTTSDSWSRSKSQGDLNGPLFRHASAPPPVPHFLSACMSWQRSHHIKCHPKPIIHKWKCLTKALPPLRGAHGLPGHMLHHLCLSWGKKYKKIYFYLSSLSGHQWEFTLLNYSYRLLAI